MRRTRDQVILDFVQGWLGKAEGDLRASEHLVELAGKDYFAATFHAEQAAEKFLKAFLVRHQIPFPKTHDIQRLLDLCSPADPSLQTELSSAAMLTPFGVEFRYPGQQITNREIATQAVEEAKRVRAAVMQRLGSYLQQGRPPGPTS